MIFNENQDFSSTKDIVTVTELIVLDYPVSIVEGEVLKDSWGN